VLRAFEHAYGRAPEQVEEVALPEGWQGDRASLLGTLKILAANGADDFHLNGGSAGDVRERLVARRPVLTLVWCAAPSGASVMAGDLRTTRVRDAGRLGRALSSPLPGYPLGRLAPNVGGAHRDDV
jgi:hypothetical protein